MSQAIARTARRMSAGVNQPLTRQGGGKNARGAPASPETARRIVIAETEQARAQCGKCFDHVFHGYKDTISRCNPHIFPKVVLFLQKGIQ